nr:MAG TPA: hypothetical protein [Microviridae sp.]
MAGPAGRSLNQKGEQPDPAELVQRAVVHPSDLRASSPCDPGSRAYPWRPGTD